MKSAVLVRIAALLLALAVSSVGAASAADLPELAALCDADQADRSTPGVLSPQAIERDAQRKEAALALIKQGRLSSGYDYYCAALLMQHGTSDADIQLSHSLASISDLIDPNPAAKWLAAASWDRYMLRKKLPQWYGTQYEQDPKTRRWRLYAVDAARVTDAERAALGLPSLREARSRAKLLGR